MSDHDKALVIANRYLNLQDEHKQLGAEMRRIASELREAEQAFVAVAETNYAYLVDDEVVIRTVNNSVAHFPVVSKALDA